MKIDGRAAVVAPDNVLFEGGAGEKVRQNLLQKCCVHTLLRLPTGIWYSPGVKANVIFFDKKEGCAEVWTDKLWVYDLRTNQHFTLKQKPIQRSDFFSQTASYSDPHTADHAPGRIPDLNHTPEALGPILVICLPLFVSLSLTLLVPPGGTFAVAKANLILLEALPFVSPLRRSEPRRTNANTSIWLIH